MCCSPTSRTTPSPCGSRTHRGSRNTDWGGLMAASTLTAIPVIIFFLLVQRQIAFGLTAGAGRGDAVTARQPSGCPWLPVARFPGTRSPGLDSSPLRGSSAEGRASSPGTCVTLLSCRALTDGAGRAAGARRRHRRGGRRRHPPRGARRQLVPRKPGARRGRRRRADAAVAGAMAADMAAAGINLDFARSPMWTLRRTTRSSASARSARRRSSWRAPGRVAWKASRRAASPPAPSTSRATETPCGLASRVADGRRSCGRRRRLSFRAAIEAGVTAIMSAHIRVREIGDEPTHPESRAVPSCCAASWDSRAWRSPTPWR